MNSVCVVLWPRLSRVRSASIPGAMTPIIWKRAILVLFVGVAAGASPGCIELQYLLGAPPPNGGNGPSPGNGDGNGTGGDDPQALRVRLSASNITPQLDETVTLTCSLESGFRAGVTFSFESTRPRIQTDPNLGTAQFIVQSTDLGTAYSFSCAANLLGREGPRSSTLIVTPTALSPP